MILSFYLILLIYFLGYVYLYLFISQAREKFLSLRKGTKTDVAAILEEVLFDANLVNVHLHILVNVFIMLLEIFRFIKSYIVWMSSGASQCKVCIWASPL